MIQDTTAQPLQAVRQPRPNLRQVGRKLMAYGERSRADDEERCQKQ